MDEHGRRYLNSSVIDRKVAPAAEGESDPNRTFLFRVRGADRHQRQRGERPLVQLTRLVDRLLDGAGPLVRLAW
jgi:hypothetical protein